MISDKERASANALAHEIDQLFSIHADSASLDYGATEEAILSVLAAGRAEEREKALAECEAIAREASEEHDGFGYEPNALRIADAIAALRIGEGK